MTKNSEYATLSLEVYRNNDDNVLLPPGRLPVSWQIFYDFIPNDQDHGYFGSAYINTATNQVVIAHRGTEPTDVGDLENDLKLALEAIPDQYNLAAKFFVDEVKILFAQQFPTLNPSQYITHTGHSLGAFLAELCSTRDGVKAVTFDSPGSRPNIQNLISSGEFPSSALTTADQNTITFNAAPNFVNTANEHVGKLYRTYPDYLPASNTVEPAPIYYTATFSLSNQHSMKGIYQQFLPGTDLPRTYSEPASWPTGTLVPESGYNSYRSYDDNPHYWERYMKARWEQNPIISSAHDVVLLQDAYPNFAAYRQAFIHDSLVSSPTAKSEPGATIIADDTGGEIWGTTAKRDTVTAGLGDHTHRDFSGDDVYEDAGGDETYVFKKDHGKDTVNDTGGIGHIEYEGLAITGEMTPASNKPNHYYLDIEERTAVFTQDASSLTMTVDKDLDENTQDSVTIENFHNGTLSLTYKPQTDVTPCQPVGNGESCEIYGTDQDDTIVSHYQSPIDLRGAPFPPRFNESYPHFTRIYPGLGNNYVFASNAGVAVWAQPGEISSGTIICGDPRERLIDPSSEPLELFDCQAFRNYAVVRYERECSVLLSQNGGNNTISITYNPNAYLDTYSDYVSVGFFQSGRDRIDLTAYQNIGSLSDMTRMRIDSKAGIYLCLQNQTQLFISPLSNLNDHDFIFYGSGYVTPTPPTITYHLGDNTDETIAATKPGSYYNGLGGKDTMVAEISQKGAPTTVRGGADDDRFTVVGSPSGLARRDTLEASQSQQSLPTDKDRALRAAFYAEEPQEYTAQPSSLWSRATSYVTSSWNSFWDEVEEEMEYDREVETDGVWLDGSEDFPERKQAKLAERAVTERDANAQELILSDFNPELTNSTETGELTASETITLEGYTSYFGNNVGNVPVVARDNGTELQIPGYNVFLPYVAPGQFNASLHLQLTDGAGAGDGDGNSNAGVIAGAVVGTVVPLTGMLVLAAVGGALAYRYREPIKNAAGTSASWVLERYHTAMGHEAAVIAAPAPDLNDAIEMQNVAGDDGSKQDEERGEERGEEDNLGATPPATVVPFPYMGSGPAAPAYRHVHPRKPLPPVPGTPVVDSKEKEKEKEGNPTENQENENGSGMWQRAGTKSAIMRSYQSREHDGLPPSFTSRLRPTVPAPEGEKEYAGDSSIYEGNPLPEERNDGAEEMTYGHQQGGTVLPFVPASSTLRNQPLRVRDVVTTFLKSKYATNAVYKDPAARQKILDLLQKNVLKTEKSTVVLSMSQVGNGEGQITEEVIVQAIFTYAVSALLQKSGRTMEEARESPEFMEAIANVHKDIQNAVYDVITSPEKQQDLAA